MASALVAMGIDGVARAADCFTTGVAHCTLLRVRATMEERVSEAGGAFWVTTAILGIFWPLFGKYAGVEYLLKRTLLQQISNGGFYALPGQFFYE